MRRRPEREDVDDHRLVVALPVVGVEPVLRRPAHRDARRARRRGPRPVRPPEELVRERAHLPFRGLGSVEIGLAEERARETQRRVDRRELDLLEAPSRLHVEEVVEESPHARDAGRGLSGRRVAEEAQRRQRPLARLLARDPAALGADRIRREPESDGRHAREGGRRLAVGHEAVLRIRLVPEPAERALLEVVEEGDVFGREAGLLPRDGDGPEFDRRRGRARARDRENGGDERRKGGASDRGSPRPVCEERRAARDGHIVRTRSARRTARGAGCRRCSACRSSCSRPAAS